MKEKEEEIWREEEFFVWMAKLWWKIFGGKSIRRIWWILFVKVSISLKLKKFERKTLISLPFHSIPSYTKSSFPFVYLPFLFLPPLSFLSKIIFHSVKIFLISFTLMLTSCFLIFFIPSPYFIITFYIKINCVLHSYISFNCILHSHLSFIWYCPHNL